MDVRRIGSIAAVLVAIPAALAAEPVGDTGRPTVTVRTFNYVRASGSDVPVAQIQAERILREAGIDVLWLDCWDVDKEPTGASSQCRQQSGPNDVILRIQFTNAMPGKPLVSMGSSLVQSRNGASHLSTVYADQVALVASRAGVDARVLLGRAIAHEIGHLLLDSNAHAKAGLMRAVWSQAELRRHHSGDWSFQNEEATIMRAALSARVAAGN